jgi:hypothetical protein
MWTIDELKQYFTRKGIPEQAYSFYAEVDDAICLSKFDAEWLVYYSERGSKRELGWGKSEAQALEIMKLFVLESSGKLAVKDVT